MKNRLKIITGLFILTLITSIAHADSVSQAAKQWRAPVANAAALPTFGNQQGDVRYCYSTNQLYGWSGAAWAPLGGSGVGDLVSVSAADTTPGYLTAKLTVGNGISKTIAHPAANEELDLNVLYDNSSIGVDGFNQLYVKDTGIVATMLNADTAGAGLVLNGVTNALDVNVDDSTIEVNTDIVRVKASGITDNELNTGAVTETKYADDSLTPVKLHNAGVPAGGSFLSYSGTDFLWVSSASAVMPSIAINIHQHAHGFAIGDVVRFDSGTSSYVKALADTSTDAEVAGIVYTTTPPDDFVLALGGNINGLAGLTAGTVYFLSDVTPGLLTATPPSTIGHISKPLVIAVSATQGYYTNWRGTEIGVAEAPASCSYITAAAEGSLTAERVMTAGTGVTVTDGGAGTTITVAIGQAVATSSAVTFATVDTGQGANELYDMDQNVLTTSDVIFNKVTTPSLQPSGGDNTGKIGDSGVRWANIYCTNIYTGDIKMMNDWVIKEDWGGLNGIILVSPEGKKYKFVMEEIK